MEVAMTVQDDLRRLSAGDAIYLGIENIGGHFRAWYKGRLQQANNGQWIFRSISGDGSIVAWELGLPTPNWESFESPASGIIVKFDIFLAAQEGQIQIPYLHGLLQQQLPQDDLA